MPVGEAVALDLNNEAWNCDKEKTFVAISTQQCPATDSIHLLVEAE